MALAPEGPMVSRRPGGCSGITPGIDGSDLFEPVNHPGFLLKKARLRVRTGGTVNRGRLIISVREAELLQDAADELHNGGLFTAGFFSGSHILSVSIDGRSFVKKKNSALLFYSFSEKGKVRILINPNKGLIKVSATSFTLPIDDYNLSPVCAFIDIGSFRYDIDLQDVDGQLKVTKTALTFTVRNVRKF